MGQPDDSHAAKKSPPEDIRGGPIHGDPIHAGSGDGGSDDAGSHDGPWPRRVAILGVGLLGGSVGLALRRSRPSAERVGWIRSPATRERALAAGAIDRAVADLGEACAGCDVIVVATPVDRIAGLVLAACRHAPDDCLVTDVGSTKRQIVAAVGGDPSARRKFVPAHPIAGGEKAGVEHATASLFDGRMVVLTPPGRVAPGPAAAAEPSDPAMVAAENRCRSAEAFWRSLGAETLRMSAEDHDAHLASTSHVPHLVAAAVARLVTAESHPLVGTGWLDATRIAAGDPDLWTAIVAANRSAILARLDSLRGDLDELRSRISSADDPGLTAWLAEAKRIRDRPPYPPQRKSAHHAALANRHPPGPGSTGPRR